MPWFFAGRPSSPRGEGERERRLGGEGGALREWEKGEAGDGRKLQGEEGEEV